MSANDKQGSQFNPSAEEWETLLKHPEILTPRIDLDTLEIRLEEWEGWFAKAALPSAIGNTGMLLREARFRIYELRAEIEKLQAGF